MNDDIILELAYIERKAREAVAAKLAAKQLGEAWKDLPVVAAPSIVPKAA